MNFKQKSIDAIPYFCSAALGFVVGKMISFQDFEISKAIDLVDLLSIIVTLLIAYIVSKVIDKEKQDSRIEKDLLLKRVEDIYQLSEESQALLAKSDVLYQDATSSIKQTYVTLNTICKVITKTSIKVNEDFRGIILNNLRTLKDILTKDTPVTAGVIHLNRDKIILVEGEFSKLKDNILLFQLAINKG